MRGEARRPRAQQIGGRTVRGGRRRARRCAARPRLEERRRTNGKRLGTSRRAAKLRGATTSAATADAWHGGRGSPGGDAWAA